jgi:hypothetical protein
VRLRSASVLLVLILSAGCGVDGRVASSSVPSPSVQSATPLIDVNDMMGAFPPATFLVATKDSVKALALLNHAMRYTISVSGGDPQVAAAGTAGRVYVLDQIAEGARVRWFDIDTGTERASRVIPDTTAVRTGAGHGGLAVDETTGTVYALLRDSRLSGTRVDELDWFTLRPSRTMLRAHCGERLAAASGRVAMACFIDKEGAIFIADGTGEFHVATGGGLVALAMSGDGTLMAGDEKGNLVRLGRHATELERISTLKDYGKGLIRDGIAVNVGGGFYFGITDAQANDVQLRLIAGGIAIVAFPASSPPTGGLFVQAPFAYFVINGRARHVDINQGFGEVMADLGESAVPGAVVYR